MPSQLHCPTGARRAFRTKQAGRVAVALAVLLGAMGQALAQPPGPHYWHAGNLPPGAIGGRQLQRGGPLPGFFQTVQITAPEGALIALPVDGQFDQPQPGPVKAGMLIGAVYRLAVLNIPFHTGIEVFPTIEIIDRLYAPLGQERRFAIPIELTQEDLELAISGKFVTRVIFLENPRAALPARQTPEQNWFDVGPGRDPLAVADALGRPVAILRLGARVPGGADPPGSDFFFGCPPLVKFIAAPDGAGPLAASPESVPAPRGGSVPQ